MDTKGLPQYAVEGYTAVAGWVYDNPVATDSIVLVAVVGSLVYFARRTLRMRRLYHRIRWGAGMKRSKNREAFERGLISFGICDAIEEAVFRGDMTRERADGWYTAFAEDYGMMELRPGKMTTEQLKQNINKRIQFWERLKVIIPGAKPGEGMKVDKTYKPTNVVAIGTGLSRSKYATAKAV